MKCFTIESLMNLKWLEIVDSKGFVGREQEKREGETSLFELCHSLTKYCLYYVEEDDGK